MTLVEGGRVREKRGPLEVVSLGQGGGVEEVEKANDPAVLDREVMDDIALEGLARPKRLALHV